MDIRVFDPQQLAQDELIYYKLAQTNQFVNSWVVMELLYRIQELRAKVIEPQTTTLQ